VVQNIKSLLNYVMNWRKHENRDKKSKTLYYCLTALSRLPRENILPFEKEILSIALSICRCGSIECLKSVFSVLQAFDTPDISSLFSCVFSEDRSLLFILEMVGELATLEANRASRDVDEEDSVYMDVDGVDKEIDYIRSEAIDLHPILSQLHIFLVHLIVEENSVGKAIKIACLKSLGKFIKASRKVKNSLRIFSLIRLSLLTNICLLFHP